MPEPSETTVSFVVPTRNSDRTIFACLQSVRRQQTIDGELSVRSETVVVDNNSDDQTAVIAAEFADVLVTAGPERSAQRNVGAAAATGSILIFVDSDMVLTDRVALDARRLLTMTDVAAAVIPERSFGSGYFARCRVLEKQLYLGVERVEAARVFRRSDFELHGGYDETLTGPEDWELPDRLRAAGHQIGRIAAEVWHDEGKVSLRSTFRKKRYYGRSVPRYLDRGRSVARSKFLRGVPLRNLVPLARHPLHVPGLALLKAVDVGGIMIGMRDARADRR